MGWAWRAQRWFYAPLPLTPTLPRNLSKELGFHIDLGIKSIVIPAQAGIQWAVVKTGKWMRCLDSMSFPRRRELRENDEGKVVPCAQAGCRCASR